MDARARWNAATLAAGLGPVVSSMCGTCNAGQELPATVEAALVGRGVPPGVLAMAVLCKRGPPTAAAGTGVAVWPWLLASDGCKSWAPGLVSIGGGR